jgi:hypothetical protein
MKHLLVRTKFYCSWAGGPVLIKRTAFRQLKHIQGYTLVIEMCSMLYFDDKKVASLSACYLNNT